MKKIKKEMKEKAINCLKQLNIFKPYINGFEKENTVCYFENFAGFWAWQDSELIEKVREIEEKYDCLVYGITHEFTEFGELYDFLMITKYKEEWDTLFTKDNCRYYAFAYVWNKTCEQDSDLGTIALASYGGGIRRIG